jgi:preprotein translocase subunit YajC
MWKKVAIGGGTIALIGGLGTAALATSGSSSLTPSAGSASPSSSASHAPGSDEGNGAAKGKAHRNGNGKGRGFKNGMPQRAKNFEHGTWVTSGSGSSTVTHTAFHGQVTAVSATSISVKAKDNATQTFVVNGDTKVHTRAQHKDAPIASVKSGDTVFVSGTGTGTVTAQQIVDSSR